MKLSPAKITRFTEGKFLIQIVETDTEFESWLGHNDYGIFDFMFALPKKQPDGEMTAEEFLKVVRKALPNFKKEFEAEHIDEI